MGRYGEGGLEGGKRGGGGVKDALEGMVVGVLRVCQQGVLIGFVVLIRRVRLSYQDRAVDSLGVPLALVPVPTLALVLVRRGSGHYMCVRAGGSSRGPLRAPTPTRASSVARAGPGDGDGDGDGDGAGKGVV